MTVRLAVAGLVFEQFDLFSHDQMGFNDLWLEIGAF